MLDRILKTTLVVYDQPETCPYLPNRMASMPLRFPLQSLRGQLTDDLLAAGFRRSGKLVYQTQCEGCRACVPLRIAVEDFSPNRSQKRALKRGNSSLTIHTGPAIVDDQRVHLFNQHRNLRGLNHQGTEVDAEEYKLFLVDSCVTSFEINYYDDQKLIGVAICDRGVNAMSAVYTYYDPDYNHLSPGTYSILKQIEYCQQNDLKFLYLGFYVSSSPHMNYKKNFRPHQRRIDGAWENLA
ncbi:MAG: arginyltransferase [Pirellulaceae bacterium]|jgi:leucyl-tRNA---protein transferase|nr:arginyltransferase [Pirellulaceae bacterium]